MKTKEAATRLKVTGATIRIWTGKNGPFVDYMSESGRGGTGRSREFSDRDLRIMAAINDMSNRGMDREQIRNELEGMKDDGWIALPPMPVPDGFESTDLVPMMPEAQAITAMERQQQEHTAIVAAKDERIGELAEELTTEREAHDKTRGEMASNKQELGKAQGKLETLESTADRERATWQDNRRLLLIAVVSLAVVLLIAVVALVWLALQGGAV